MPLHYAFLACLGAFALLEFFVLPILRDRLRVNPTMTRISLAAWLAVLGVLRNLLLAALVTTGALAALAFVLLRLTDGVRVEAIEEAMAMLEGWRERVRAVSTAWGAVLVVLLTAALAVHAHRSAKRRMEGLFSEVYRGELERVRAQSAAGVLPELPPSPQMEHVAADKQENFAKIERFTRETSTGRS